MDILAFPLPERTGKRLMSIAQGAGTPLGAPYSSTWGHALYETFQIVPDPCLRGNSSASQIIGTENWEEHASHLG